MVTDDIHQKKMESQTATSNINIARQNQILANKKKNKLNKALSDLNLVEINETEL